MAVPALRREAPASYDECAALLADCAGAGARVRIAGGGTKAAWGSAVPDPDVELSTARLDRILEHNEGDLTAILQAGVPVAAARERFAAAGQMLALDPPLGAGATIGGVVAAADSGPLRHRYGSARDLVLGVTVALADGSLARAGGRVIKNVAGYDLPKLFAGSFGTLGAILELAVRLHPLPRGTATALLEASDPEALARAAAAIAHARLEAQSLDVAWAGGRGRVLARYAGSEAVVQAREAARELGGGDVVEDDEPLWEEQREAQRGELTVRVSGLQTQLGDAMRAAEAAGASLAARAALGLMWVRLPGGGAGAVRGLRRALAPSPCVVLDAPAEVRAELDPWDARDGVELMRRVKRRFDPEGILNPGVFAGGI